MAGFDWGAMGGGAQQGLEQLVAERLLQEKLALAQRQQQAEEEYRRASLAEQAAGRGDVNRRFERTQGFEEGKYRDAAPQRAEELIGTRLGNEGKGIANATGQFNLDTAKSEQSNLDALANDPTLAPVIKLYKAGVKAAPVDAFDPTGETAFGRERTLIKDRGDQSARTASIDGGMQRPITATAQANLMGQIQRRYETATKDYRTTRQAVAMMDEAVKELDARGMNDPAGQSIIVKFQNTLDPNSVVREGEYARTAEGQPLFDQMRVAFTRISTGGPAVKVQALKQYVDLSRKFLERQREWARAQRDLAGRQADFAGIPRENVFAADADLDAPTQETPTSGGGRRGRYNPATKKIEY